MTLVGDMPLHKSDDLFEGTHDSLMHGVETHQLQLRKRAKCIEEDEEKATLPERLVDMLSKAAAQCIVRWSRDGKAFDVLNEAKFVSDMLPQFGFRFSSMLSFKVRELLINHK